MPRYTFPRRRVQSTGTAPAGCAFLIVIALLIILFGAICGGPLTAIVAGTRSTPNAWGALEQAGIRNFEVERAEVLNCGAEHLDEYSFRVAYRGADGPTTADVCCGTSVDDCVVIPADQGLDTDF
jgi:hypothetical protein